MMTKGQLHKDPMCMLYIKDPKLEYMQDPTVMRISLHKDPMYMLYIKDPKTEYMQDPTVIVFRRPNKR